MANKLTERYPNIEALAQELKDTWCAETSADPDQWSVDNPAWGQCAITAMIVQDLYGGVLLRTTVGGLSHYFNEIGDGDKVDLTASQFEIYEFDSEVVIRERDYVEGSEATMVRYELLRSRLGLDAN